MAQTIARRDLIIGGASAATVAVVSFPVGAQGTITVDQFRALSARLTGVAVMELDATAAGKLLAGFISMGRGGELARLAAGRRGTRGTLANDIVAAWYSGRYVTRAGAAAIDLRNALVWKALHFTKPRGDCGGVTGYWAEPYQN
jgi:hypothetical protein